MFKKEYLLSALIVFSPALASAQDMAAQPTAAPAPAAEAAPALPAITNDPKLDEGIRYLQNAWAVVKYQVKDKEKQVKQLDELAKNATIWEKAYPTYAEPKIWHAIILSTKAGVDGGLDALGLVKEAKKLLEQAIKINPKALEGSAFTSLGSLYYKVPAWPIGFGDDEKARSNLEQARAINPDGIDPNYFYGDFLNEQGQYEKAIPILERALQSAPRPGREVADAGRKGEIQDALKLAHEKLGK